MDQTFKDRFSEIVESLKRSQRADLIDENNHSILDDLYVDPFEGNLIIKQMLNDQTTLLIGRKGTGKSTIINKFQHEIRKTPNKISLYIDVRTVLSKSEGSRDTSHFPNTLGVENQQKLSIYSSFIKKVIEEIKLEINKNVFAENSNWLDKIRSLFIKKNQSVTESNFIDRLEEISKQSLDRKFIDITAFQQCDLKKDSFSKLQQKSNSSSGLVLSPTNITVNQTDMSINDYTESQSNQVNYASVLKREFYVSDFADDLKKLLQSIGITKVYLCLDDCSELDKDVLEVFVKTIVAPLHNDSEGFFRFKISFYPDRNVLPEIDRTKIDTLFLDYYEMYKSSGADKVEEQAMDFIKRLIRTRIKYFFQVNDDGIRLIENQIFDTKTMPIEEYYKLIFYACSCVPRNIGRLLFYCDKKSITQGKSITKSIIQESAKEQYINEIEPLITKDEFFQYKSYSEIYRRTQLKELVSLIIQKAKENKKHIGDSDSDIFKAYTPSNAPSHFLFVKKDLLSYLSTLEINNFITRISEQKDKGTYIGGKFVSNDIVVYTINYGLCQSENIVFEEPNNRKYRIERIFDFNRIITDWANNSACVICSNCSAEYDISEWSTIQNFDCYCRVCKTVSTCVLTPKFDNSISNTEEIIEINGRLKPEQLRIIHSLYIENYLTENQIAGDLDVSAQTVRAYLRSDRKLLVEEWIGKDDDSRKYYITEKSLQNIYDNLDTTTDN